MRNWLSWTARPGVASPSRCCPQDGLQFVTILLFATAVPVFARVPLPRLAYWLEPRRRRLTADPDRIQDTLRSVDAALAMGWPLVRRGCLTRAITRYYFLRRAGLDVGLHFGVGKVAGAFEGHCWLEKDGAPFLEATDPRPYFSAIYRLPSQKAA
jgi:hypothetical protein